MHLSFEVSFFWTHEEVENAGEVLAEQLDAGHRVVCPWKGNSYVESLAQFPPTPPFPLVGGYNDFCDALLQFSALPVIFASAINQMKLSRGPQIDCILLQLQPVIISELSGRADNMSGAELYQEEAANANYQAQRLISLYGWEARLLPNMVDCEEHSAQSARNACSADPSHGQFHPVCDLGPSVLFILRSPYLDKRDATNKKISVMESRYDPASVVLDCSLCGATVRLCNFVTVARSSRFTCSLSELPETSKKLVLTRGVSAASGIDGWCTIDAMERETLEDRDEAATTFEGKSASNVGMDVNLMIAGGPPPTHIAPLRQLCPWKKLKVGIQ